MDPFFIFVQLNLFSSSRWIYASHVIPLTSLCSFIIVQLNLFPIYASNFKNHHVLSSLNLIEYGWGSGKAEVNAYLSTQKETPTKTTEGETKTTKTTTSTTPTTTSTTSTTTTPTQIIVPVTKGLCCILYEDITSLNHKQGPFRLPASISHVTEEYIQWKQQTQVLCQHLYTLNFFKSVSDLSEGQTHVGACLLDIGSNIVIVGCHLTFKGSSHPDVNGSHIRAQQIQVIQKEVQSYFQTKKNGERGICCLAGDINIRPLKPNGNTVKECALEVDVYLSLSNNGSQKMNWSDVEEWYTTPHFLSRSKSNVSSSSCFILHPPTYPIRNHHLWERLMEKEKVKGVSIFHSPKVLHDAMEEMQRLNGKDGGEKEMFCLYDTYHKNRFTPSSYTDGMLVFDV